MKNSCCYCCYYYYYYYYYHHHHHRYYYHYHNHHHLTLHAAASHIMWRIVSFLVSAFVMNWICTQPVRVVLCAVIWLTQFRYVDPVFKNKEGCVGIDSKPFAWRGWGKPRKSVRIFGLRDEIWTGGLLSTKQACQPVGRCVRFGVTSSQMYHNKTDRRSPKDVTHVI
jgi:hypothetical protein